MKLNEKNVLKILIACKEPMLVSDLAKIIKCDSKSLEEYLYSLEQSGLVLSSRYAYKGDSKYSPRRGKTAYRASAIANEYLKKKSHDSVAFVCTIIAALMSILSLIATVLIPLFG